MYFTSTHTNQIRKAASEGHTDKIEKIIDKESKKDENLVDVRDFEVSFPLLTFDRVLSSSM